MTATIEAGIRRKQTAADVLAVAEVSQFNDIRLNPHKGCVDLSGDFPQNSCGYATDMIQNYGDSGDKQLDDLTLNNFREVSLVGPRPTVPGDAQEQTFAGNLNGALAVDGQTVLLEGQPVRLRTRTTLRSDTGDRRVLDSELLDLVADIDLPGHPLLQISLDTSHLNLGAFTTDRIRPRRFSVESEFSVKTVLGLDTDGDRTLDTFLAADAPSVLVARQFFPVAEPTTRGLLLIGCLVACACRRTRRRRKQHE